MMTARHGIGIDLGTSNSAVARWTRDSPRPSILPIAQCAGPGLVEDRELLPSFLYHPRPEEAATLGPDPVPGHWARDEATRSPGRVTQAAKSWLCHRGADREAPFLPWGGDEVPSSARLSPVDASARLLATLRTAALRAHDGEPPGSTVITVPASFGPDAQELTLRAARQAGFDGAVRLLEEPQAVFYDWLSRHQTDGALSTLIDRHGRAGELHLLVCDIGGGTTDFSLFRARLARADAAASPELARVAVGEHLLLGGDNFDLALAHELERRLGPPAPDPAQWAGLVAAARSLKEAAWRETATDDDAPLRAALPGRAGRLWGGARTVEIRPSEIRTLLLESFFPPCPPDARARRAAAGLRELGLPYAPDPAITRHLAEFVRGHRVDALLCNGGTLLPAPLRRRLLDLLGSWQDREIAELENPSPTLAVALGAAWYGRALDAAPADQPRLIESRTARGYWLETARAAGAPATDRPWLVCIAPQGTPLDQPVLARPDGLRARVNRETEFRLYTTRDPGSAAGDLRQAGEADERLPALRVRLQIPAGLPRPANDLLPVRLETTTTGAGALRLRCLPVDPPAGYPEGWTLDWRLNDRGPDTPHAPAASETDAPSADDAALHARLAAAVRETFGPAGDDAAARRLGPRLEALAGAPREDWPPARLRALWPALAEFLTKKGRSAALEATWLNWAGYCLRPGRGWPHDDARVEELWRLAQVGLTWGKDPAVRPQAWIIWRRVAAGLAAERQTELWQKWENRLKGGEPEAELLRAACCLERIGQNRRLELLDWILARGAKWPAKLREPWWWATGRLLARTPLCGDPATVLPASAITRALPFWEKNHPGEALGTALNALAQAVRPCGLRELEADQPARDRARILMKNWGATAEQITRLDTRETDETHLWRQLAGERLPSGLWLAAAAAPGD